MSLISVISSKASKRTGVPDKVIVDGIGSLTLSGFTSGTGKISANGAGDRTVKAYYNVDTCIENCIIQATVKVTTTTTIFGIGKDPGSQIAGTLVEIGTDDTMKFYLSHEHKSM